MIENMLALFCSRGGVEAGLKDFVVDLGGSKKWLSLEFLKPIDIVLEESMELAVRICCGHLQNKKTFKIKGIKKMKYRD